MSINQIVAVLRARWMLMAGVFLLVIVTTMTITFLLPSKYTGRVFIVLDVRSPDLIAGGYVPGLMSASYMATQIDILKSDRVAQRVVSMLKLDQNNEIRQQWQQETGGRGDFKAWLAALLLDNVEVVPSRSSNVLEVRFTGIDPKFAAVMANSFVQAYVDTNLELRVAPARQYSGFFEERSAIYREQLEGAQAKLSSYQREHGLLATDERLDVESMRLNELSSQLVALQAMSAESTSREAQSRRSAEDLRDVLTDPVVTGLRSDLNRQEVQLQQLSARLGEAHPQVVELKASMSEVRARIAIETRKVSGSLTSTNNINVARESQIKASLEAQRTKVLKLKAQRDEAQILLKDVETAQRAYDTVLGRLNQTNLESHTTLTNIGVLSPATEPPSPSSPRKTLNLAVSILMGMLLAVAIALLREMFDRRVNTAEDLTEQLQLPLLCVMPGPLGKRRFALRADPRLLMQQRVLGLPAATR